MSKNKLAFYGACDDYCVDMKRLANKAALRIRSDEDVVKEVKKLRATAKKKWTAITNKYELHKKKSDK